MNATLSDEELVRTLRARADLALPEMSLDAGETVVAGRRHRRRRAVAGSVSAVAALALVAGVALGVIPLPRPAPVATQVPRTLGTDPSIEAAHNMWATNVPISRRGPDGDWLDLNLSVEVDTRSPAGGRMYMVGVQALDDLPDDLAGVTVAARDGFDGGDGSSLGTAATVTWSTDGTDDRDALYPAAQRALFQVPPSSLGSDFRNNVVVLVGAVPSWLESPRVFVTYPEGVTNHEEMSGGPTTFEVPTFRSPGTDGTLLYALRENTSIANYIELQDVSPPFTTFVGADGTTVAGEGCVRIDACTLTAEQVLGSVEP
ncbi:hypothetical protein [Cellulomonas sp. Leaf334]|uniref:hypothetical protein n=1 Tax=Cellulomonas sp. Leaf334 TaxID=1736339 RepID=UPI0006F54021|nr:hypothetical protein [Cellulomonas sp. Leaf334]KQR16515.1 hypothetical protein ASF78_03840 [Cellulomonas sp. Leaf334]